MNSNEWQFTNLENSKRMKELGFLQESAFYWCKNRYGLSYRVYGKNPNTRYWEYVASAYSVAELGKMLPEGKFSSSKETYWVCNYGGVDIPQYAFHSLGAETEADSRSLMLIWLAEQGYIEPSSI